MTMEAGLCPNGHASYPTHPRCPDCGEHQDAGTIDLAELTAEVVTWTHSTKTPPGVSAPNTLAIVEFDVSGLADDDDVVRAIGQVTTDDVETGDEVEPVYAEELRDPEAGIKVPASQEWDGYRFDPV